MSDKPGSSTSGRLLNPAPKDLRNLVLDYLVHSCYTRAARAFVRESGVNRVDADGDDVMNPPEKELCVELGALEDSFAMGELRKDIRSHILTGGIDEATVLLNKHFPSVLSEDSEDAPQPTPSPGKLEYLPSTSVDPTHLTLNLRIQAFIEAARTVPLPYYPPGSDTPLPHLPLLSGPASRAASGEEDAVMTESDAEAANVQLLHRAQSLYSEASQLTRATDRATYLHELAQVGGILAYPEPEGSSLAVYMTQDRRESVANQIDGAILSRAKRATISRIELYTRYTGTLWGMLHDKEVKIPPRSTWPTGVSLPPAMSDSQETKAGLPKDTGRLESAVPTAKKPIPDTETEEVIPRFDLHLFLKECR